MNEDIAIVEPNIRYKTWGIKAIEADKAWSLATGKGIIVSVVDTGVNYHHESLINNMWRNTDGSFGKNYLLDNNDVLDKEGHGSHIAGIIAGFSKNKGLSGVAPDATIMAMKPFNAFYTAGSDVYCAKAIIDSVDYGAHIINISWGRLLNALKGEKNDLIEDAIAYAYQRNVVIVCAAGNNNEDTQFISPANNPNVICVAATDSKDRATYDTNYGDNVAVCAPGYNIYSFNKSNNGYHNKSGTSMAAPFVTGIVALLLEINNRLTPQEIKKIIIENADFLPKVSLTDPIAYKQVKIGKRVNAFKSVHAAMGLI